MEGLEKVRKIVNGILLSQKEIELQSEGWVHLYGVSQAATALAARRGLDTQLCAACGMLHDIYTYRTGKEKDHAKLGAPEAADILLSTGAFSPEDIDKAFLMISRHSDKQAVDGPLEECLKDADVLAHWLYDDQKKFDKSKKARLVSILNEFGLKGSVEEE